MSVFFVSFVIVFSFYQENVFSMRSVSVKTTTSDGRSLVAAEVNMKQCEEYILSGQFEEATNSLRDALQADKRDPSCPVLSYIIRGLEISEILETYKMYYEYGLLESGRKGLLVLVNDKKNSEIFVKIFSVIKEIWNLAKRGIQTAPLEVDEKFKSVFDKK